MGGCVSNATGDTSPDYTPGSAATLQPGGQLVLPDSTRLRYVGVVADSRCPPGVQCIRAGDADVRFEVTPASGQPQVLTLNIPEHPAATVAGWQVRILDLAFDEAPPVTIQVDPVAP